MSGQLTAGGWRRWLLAAAALLAVTACADRPEPYRQESYVFGTRVEVSVANLPQAQAAPAVTAALAELDRMHNKLHAWQAGSDVVRLNQAFAAGRAAPVDAELAGLIRLAQDGERNSDGLFNPAIGRLVELWGFHADRFAPVAPPTAALRAVLALHPSTLDITVADGMARSRNPDVALDFGGLAKGWALDRVADILHRHGVRDALINIGGNVLALGEKAPGVRWKVGIQHPRDPRAMAVVALQPGEAMGTSGDYQRFFMLDGQRYCHLIDPRDGNARCRVQAVTVLVERGTDRGLRSDVASKPVYFAGAAGALRAAGRFGIQSVLLVDGEGGIHVSPAMAARLEWLIEPVHKSALVARAQEKP